MKNDNSNDLLKIEVVDGKVIISIGVDAMCHAIKMGPAWYDNFQITDQAGFVDDIVSELTREEEDGSTLVHKMFDEAARGAVENGSEHCDEVVDEDEDDDD